VSEKGIRCPRCGGKMRVYWTRPRVGEVTRRRECTACGLRVTTTEVDVSPEIVKKGLLKQSAS
jgi:transcriptional regulator NrdR family protein